MRVILKNVSMTYMLVGSLDAKEVGLGAQVGFSHNEDPTWASRPNYCFAYNMRRTMEIQALLYFDFLEKFIYCKFHIKRLVMNDFFFFFNFLTNLLTYIFHVILYMKKLGTKSLPSMKLQVSIQYYFIPLLQPT